MARPNPASVDFKDKLEADGIGTFGATSGWAIYIGEEPDSPDEVVTLYDTSSGEPNPKWALNEPHVQVRVRGARSDYLGAYDRAVEILNSLLGMPQQVLGGTTYVGVWGLNDPFLLGYDDSRRPVFTVNFRVVREPDPDGHRDAI